MKIFGIGFSGYIGKTIAEKLMKEGHALTGLARSDISATALKESGITPVIGSMENVDVIKTAASEADAVFILTLGGFLTATRGIESVFINCIDSILDTLEGTNKTVIMIGGIGGWMGNIQKDRYLVVDESLKPELPDYYAFASGPQDRILDSTKRGIRGMIVSPAGVYGRDGGYVGCLSRRFECFRKHGVIYTVYPSEALTSYIHVDDLADLFVLALEKGKSGEMYLGASDNAELMEVSRMVSRIAGLGGRLDIINKEKYEEMDGWVSAGDFNLVMVGNSDKARKELGWQPKMPGVLDELQRLIDTNADINNIYPGLSRKKALEDATKKMQEENW